VAVTSMGLGRWRGLLWPCVWGAVRAPQWQAGVAEAVLPVAYRDVLEVLADAGQPRVGNSWANCAMGLSPTGSRFTYQKANLSNGERASGRFATGNTLPVFELATPQGTAHVGVQLCREVRFPEQWRTLADKGAQLLLHLTNGRGSPTWRPHLISRAAENQRFVVSASNASPIQLSNSMVITPDGTVVDEFEQPEPGLLRTPIDLERVSDSLLAQRRNDLH
jgi:predicted amidohydrolase